MRIGKTVIIHFSSQVLRSLAGFIGTLYVARVLGPGPLGIYAVGIALLAWFKIPLDSIDSAVKKRISEGREQGEYFSSGFALRVLIILPITIAILGVESRVNSYIGAGVSELLLLLLFGNMFFQTAASSLAGQKKVAEVGVLQTIENVLRTGAQIALIILGYELTGLFVGHSLSLILAAIGGFFLFEIRPTLPTWRHIRSLIEYARFSWLGMVQSRTFAWVDTVILAIFVESALIGIYEVTWNLASLFVLISISIKSTLFPELSELDVEDDYQRIRHFLGEGIIFTGLFGIPGLFGAVVLGPRVLKIYRPEFVKGAPILVILILARLLTAYGQQFVSAINAIDRPDIAFRINFAFIVTNIGLNLLLVYLYGWYGAAVATAISSALTLGLGYTAVSKFIGTPDIPSIEIVYQFFAGAVMILFVLVSRPIVPPNHYATIALVVVGAGVYMIVLVTFSTRVRRKIDSMLPEMGV